MISGEHGTGRRISAIRALRYYLAPTDAPQPRTWQVWDLSPDWDEDEVPSTEILPTPTAGRGYLLDATQRTISAAAAQALTSWAEQLHEVGSGLVVVGASKDWPSDSRLLEPAVRPNATQVAHNHLAYRLNRTDQAHWLQPDPERAANRGGFLRQAAADQTGGIFSELIHRNVSPANAVRIAERLSRIEPRRVADAVQRINTTDKPDLVEQGRRNLQAVRDEVLEWTDYLESILADSGTRGQDRVMLVAAAYLEGAPLELCINAATEFGPRAEQSKQRYREGRSPRRRLRDVGVDVTEADTAAFNSRPGLATAAIRTDWHHWADERTQTREWLQRITAPKAVAQAWAGQVGERLLELSRTAVDPPFFAVLDSWVASPDGDDDRIALIARLLTKAALTAELARTAHKKLLDWASPKKSSAQRQVVAHVCAGEYGQRWPNTALVRLRHILAIDDEASKIAATALVRHAQNGQRLTRIIETIETWLEKYPAHPAGARAFLALIDPSSRDAPPVEAPPSADVLGTLITLAQNTPPIRDFLISGWANTLQQPDVRNAAYQALIAWADAVHDARLDREFTFGILTDVRNVHTPLDALSRFLYGNPDDEAPAIINARIALANLRACPRTDCPLTHPDQERRSEEDAQDGGHVTEGVDRLDNPEPA